MLFNKTITAADLRSHHINKHPYATDMEYTAVAKNLQKIITANVTGGFFNSAVIKELAIRLTLHLEDTVADAGVWKSFCTEHHNLYGRWLPFLWNSKKLPLDEVTPESCAFIIWMVLTSFDDTRYLNPLVPAVEALASVVYDYMNLVFEDVDINEEMLDDLYSNERLTDFYKMRDVLSWLADADGCYLSDWDTTVGAGKEEYETFRKYLSKESHITYQVRSILPFKEKVGPLALLPQEWYASMLKSHGKKSYAKMVREIAAKRFDTYLIQNCNNGVLTMKDVDGEVFAVEQESFGLGFDQRSPEHNLAITSFASYNGKWHVNGIAMFRSLTKDFDDVIKERRESVEGHERAKDFFEEMVKQNGNRRLYYFSRFEQMVDWFEENAPQRGMRKFFDGFPPYMKKRLKNILAFLPTDGDPEFSVDTCNFICDTHNPFYDRTEAKENGFDIIDETMSISGECIRFMIEHRMLQDFSFAGGDHIASHQLMQDNIDFVARYYRRGKY